MDLKDYIEKEKADSILNEMNIGMKDINPDFNYKTIGKTKPTLEQRKRKNRIKEKNRRRINKIQKRNSK